MLRPKFDNTTPIRIKANAKEYFPKPALPKNLVIIITKKKEIILSNISAENKSPVLLAIVLADDIGDLNQISTFKTYESEVNFLSFVIITMFHKLFKQNPFLRAYENSYSGK